MTRKKNIIVCNFPRFSGEIWIPYLWSQAKTFYEIHGRRVDEWNWVPCYADVYSAGNEDKIKELIRQNPPDVFAISLYVWNYNLAHEIAAWVKEEFPNCLVISGGPHQYFKHDNNWFKKHPHLDASLPGDCYGELCFTQILDLYEDTDFVDWTCVSDIHYPSRDKSMVMSSNKKMTKQEKKAYPFNWSSYSLQQEHILDFLQFQQEHFPNSLVLAVLETTRGCPYGCTYCDWGGGTNTKILQKTTETVKQDIDAAMNFDLSYLYLADANFGIFGQRDVDIISYIAQQRKQHRQLFGIGYGGYAKTANKLEYIRDILEIDVENNLSTTKELKISVQSLDEDVLKAISRKNIPLDKQLEIYRPLAKNNKLPLFVELIMGLPGINLEKYYHELDVLGHNNLSIQWYEWILLPETPAYATDYRKQHGIQTITKTKGWAHEEAASNREVVVGCNSYSSDDYFQMLMSNSLYHLLIIGGFYKSVIEFINYNGTEYGEIIRDIYENFFLRTNCCNYYKHDAYHQWKQILNDPDLQCRVNIGDESVHVGHYFIALTHLDNNIVNHLMTFLKNKYDIPEHVIEYERELHINSSNFGTVKRKSLSTLTYKTGFSNKQNTLHDMINIYYNYYDSGNITRAKKKLLGVFNVVN
jgi:putative methyltransferase